MSKLSDIIKEYVKEGGTAENFVAGLLESECGGVCRKSTEEEDKKRHIDIWWDSPKKGSIGIDVKGIKKKKWTDKDVDDSIHWIEIQGVSGLRGWIYGEMDYIAFVTKTDVIFVQPEKLYGHILYNIAGKQLVDVVPNEYYIPYQRRGRKDIVIIVPTEDLRRLSHFTIEYKNKM